MLPQYKRLQDNKRSASEFAVEIINKNPVTDGIEKLGYKLKKEKDITKAIEILAEMKDLQNNTKFKVYFCDKLASFFLPHQKTSCPCR